MKNSVRKVAERRSFLKGAAATEGFLVLENHSVDIVPEGPGLGITLNDEAMKQHLAHTNYFEPTPEWDRERSQDNLYT